MGINKDAKLRHEAIDACLRNTARKWWKADLLEEVNEKLREEYGQDKDVKESTLRHDITVMKKDLLAPIEINYEGGKVWYRYTEEFSVKDIKVSDADMNILTEAGRIMKQLDFPMSDLYKNALQKVQHKNFDVGPKIIFPEESPTLEGLQHMEDLYYAILNKNVLKMQYVKVRATQAKTYYIHPYALKEYRRLWYVISYNEESKARVPFSLDRIRSLQVTSKKYKPNDGLSPEEYYENVLGVTVYPDSKPEDIYLWFSAEVAPLIENRKIHRSQFVENNDSTGLFIKLHVVINPELIKEVLSYGNDCRVLGPASFKETIKNKILAMCKDYD